MSKQDGYSSRTAVDLERKYNFGKTFAEVYGLISDAQRAAQEAKNAFDGLSHEQIFNLLTNYGEWQGIYRDDNGDVYVNASFIKGGTIKGDSVKVEAATITGQLVATQIDTKDLKVLAANITGQLTAGQIDATNLKVSSANITGALSIGQLPEGIATTDDIPTDYVTESGVTTIVNGIVTTDYVNALGITVDAAHITGLLTASQINVGTLYIGDLYDDVGLVTEGNVTTITRDAISTATINASQITSGTINAGKLSLNGLLELKYMQLPYGYIGASDVGDTSGAVLCDSNVSNYFLVTKTGAKMSYAGSNEIWVASSGCHSTSTVTVYSDKRLKNNISYDLEEEEKLFMLFKPCSYQMNNDKAGKKRWGFIAQDVIAGAEEVGMDAEKLAVIANHEGIYSLGYGEITALNTHMIQKLMARVARLEEA